MSESKRYSNFFFAAYSGLIFSLAMTAGCTQDNYDESIPEIPPSAGTESDSKTPTGVIPSAPRRR